MKRFSYMEKLKLPYCSLSETSLKHKIYLNSQKFYAYESDKAFIFNRVVLVFTRIVLNIPNPKKAMIFTLKEFKWHICLNEFDSWLGQFDLG